ncbi:2-C-methyl-D-erythritol 4-phosphate cytidylyltransferase [Caldalkalibacillus mannanilyticus]|uniref:2-C-methyl-D-erythritol 4-phosphate cytidylyltransferase n=1 Tax=Caldalkalibacillus mannanilyticus TaxID=1418 RepID=UPI00046A0FAC|nr:2-C-methyl-D-erythritol 4-phosphate cytidylyltransferase [Caldalkalibacillus mannanilyticus]
MQIDVLICAAGQGKRMGLGHNKLFLALEGIPVLVHTLKVWEKHERIRNIVLVVSQDDQKQITAMIETFKLTKVCKLVIGGAERQESVCNGLLSYAPDSQPDMVLIHDGARPFIHPEEIDQVILATERDRAALLAAPVKDTIKQADKSLIIEKTLDRSKLWAIQTPQSFFYKDIVQAHLKAKEEGILATDDAALIERLGYPIRIVQGSYHNIKLTTPEDIDLAEFILQKRRQKDGI